MAREPYPVVIDFETEPIQPRPHYPPKPIGVAIQYPGKEPKYLAWGHPSGNNTTREKVERILKDAWTHPVLFHNAKFDLDVAEKHFGLHHPPWNRFHDTLFLLFLLNPHAASLSLKPAAAEYLDMPATEADTLRNWLIQHDFMRSSRKTWGDLIYKAPGDIVAPYAIGDVVRTDTLFRSLYPRVQETNMGSAYDRERQLLPILLRNEQQGIEVDLALLEKDVARYGKALNDADDWLRAKLGKPTLNVDSDRELAEALDVANVVELWTLTETGQKSVSKKNLRPEHFGDPVVAAVLGYRQRLRTALSTFLHPWYELASANRGRIHTNWNQVRQNHGDESMGGTRTGRLSCSPNFQNIPTDWYNKDDGYVHPATGLPELPLVRRYVLPDHGGTFGSLDYSQQELRILAHFEDDKLQAAYCEGPRMDVHEFVRTQIQQLLGAELERRTVKILNFGMIYGMGLGKLAQATKTDVETARALRSAQRRAIPGLAALERDIKSRGGSGQAIRTWGGRLYHAEPPKMINGQMRSFEYKLLNYLIQGSAADCTKQAIINYDDIKESGRFLVTVHDEINISVPRAQLKKELRRLREAMEGVQFSVPMLTDAKVGKNWADLKEHK